IVLAFGALASWVVVAVTGRLALSAVEVRLTLSPARLVAGEQAIATLEITNRKPIPLPWLEARIFLGEGLERSRGGEAPSDPPQSRRWIDCGFPLRGRERVAVRFRVAVPARGAYAIGPVRIRAGDWMGFVQIEHTVPVRCEVIAYPAPLAVRDRTLASLRPLAKTATRRGPVPAPSLLRRGRPRHRRHDRLGVQ